MTALPVGAAGGRCRLLSDEEYPRELLNQISRTRTRCLVSMFIIDPVGMNHWFPSLFEALQDAMWRRADVRVVLGGSRTNMDIAERTAGAQRILQDVGVPDRKSVV